MSCRSAAGRAERRRITQNDRRNRVGAPPREPRNRSDASRAADANYQRAQRQAVVNRRRALGHNVARCNSTLLSADGSRARALVRLERPPALHDVVPALERTHECLPARPISIEPYLC